MPIYIQEKVDPRIRSRPFPKQAGGLVAVKVINHYGDEVLKVYRG